LYRVIYWFDTIYGRRFFLLTTPVTLAEAIRTADDANKMRGHLGRYFVIKEEEIMHFIEV
jgi:hypothetical protein